MKENNNKLRILLQNDKLNRKVLEDKKKENQIQWRYYKWCYQQTKRLKNGFEQLHANKWVSQEMGKCLDS